jgi:DNA ligase-1
MRPMLAAKLDDMPARYPLLASPKLDGVRALIINGEVLSRSLKPIPNQHVQELFGRQALEGFDGELIVGSPVASDAYRATMSGVMSQSGEPDVTFHVFDNYTLAYETFDVRLASVVRAIIKLRNGNRRIHSVPHILVSHDEDLLRYETCMLSEGYEGVMLRHPDGVYKHGRATLREGSLMKLKRFEDSEAVVLGCDELMHNANEATRDELGRTKRSSHKAGKVGRGTLGALHVRDVKSGVEFDIGTGFDDATRKALWGVRTTLPGKLVKYKYFPSGSKDKPRFPVFLGFRDLTDL